ncbi:(2Fe-2S)-binding protein [Terrimonas sp.]|uniref:Rieske (2Fe-2S) protein n=1 Tax=Terrimonas sp. TaxID=1914338 RepID=UPI000D519767|nr:Rieske 2Fe-2S domain-containing protein [Terrimonas sp.]PVD49554.1 (2Fe-2S)-binding protein [Terrimonas sp.]
MPDTNYYWYKLAEHVNELDFAGNNIAIAVVNGKKICIAKYNNGLYGFAYKCPHAGGIMADGYINPAGYVVCPVHRYKFDIQTGRNVSGEGYYMKCWPVRMTEDGIFIGMK